jgi:hypothetical protein
MVSPAELGERHGALLLLQTAHIPQPFALTAQPARVGLEEDRIHQQFTCQTHKYCNTNERGSDTNVTQLSQSMPVLKKIALTNSSPDLNIKQVREGVTQM